jgi:hypothetical protein
VEKVGGDLLMSNDQNKVSFKDVELSGAKILGVINMSGASFDGTLTANTLQVSGYLSMADARSAGIVAGFKIASGLIRPVPTARGD